MLSWIRALFTRSDDLESRVEMRIRNARQAVAEKHEREGRNDLELGRETSDRGLMQTGKERLQVAANLRSDEMSLLEALNLETRSDGEDGEGGA